MVNNKQLRYGILICCVAVIAFLVFEYIDIVALQVANSQQFLSLDTSSESNSTASEKETSSNPNISSNNNSAYEDTTDQDTEGEIEEKSSVQSKVQKNANAYFNLNTATVEQLCTIDGIGEVTANKIINKRNELGSFTSLEQLKEVNGIGDKRYSTLIEHLYIE